ncbi:hypothetical protein BpHYR1_018664 [Brachionus plicatilis]|uniref:Uncharacterized protein n=1 Tax=Brachionus plicatilis TaxID=10195 RepID=A0A3M7PEU8_BRAPC|nr:hypothetical protein BpHYR1_018664 [Brachionus plicatilis]
MAVSNRLFELSERYVWYRTELFCSISCQAGEEIQSSEGSSAADSSNANPRVSIGVRQDARVWVRNLLIIDFFL